MPVGPLQRARWQENGAVFDRILKRLRDKIRGREYVMTSHAEEETDNDDLHLRR